MRSRSLVPAALVALVALAGCTKAETLKAAATTLTTIQVSTDVMWAAAMEARLSEQRIYVESIEAMPADSRPPLAAVEAKLRTIQARWEPRYAAFRAVRHAHALAIEAYNAYRDGDVDLQVLLNALNHVVGLYEEIRAMLPEPEEALPPPEES